MKQRQNVISASIRKNLIFMVKQRQNKKEKVKSCRGSTTKGSRARAIPKHGRWKKSRSSDKKKLYVKK